MKTQFDLLKTRRFLPLFAAQFLGAFNDNVFKNALVILITYRAGETAGIDPRILVTAAAGLFILPFFLFSATAGQLADKYAKSRLIGIVKGAEIPLMALGAFGFFIGHYWLLLCVLFLVGAQAAFFGPLKYATLPELLEEDELIAGNALVEAGTFLAILLGTITGGVLILTPAGRETVSVLIVALAVLGWIAALKVPKTGTGDAKIAVSANILAETWRLVRRAAQRRDVFLSIAGISWFWLVGFTFLSQFPVYARDILNADEHVVTLFLTVFSVGIAIGSLACNRLLKGAVSGALVPHGALGMTASILAFVVASPLVPPEGPMQGFLAFIAEPAHWTILLTLLSVAVFGGIYIVPLYAIMQARAEAGFRSRAVAVNNVVNALFMVLGAVFSMIMLRMEVPVTTIFLVIGICNIPAAFIIRKL